MALLALPTMLIVSATAMAKGQTVRIEIEGDTLAAPLEITDPEIVGKFSVWTGPGVRVNAEPVHMDPRHQEGMFIDWPKGMATERPKGMQRYRVSFYVSMARAPHEERLAYVVSYECGSTSDGGFVYLPAMKDEDFKLNWAIYHGVEGNWFHSSSAWEILVRPLIDEANNKLR